jgi:glycosyltransferase involved in cell wall biosynthesis
MENNVPLVSVIIPTYNRANLVMRAIDSALKQTYKHIEIIVVDDGSKDNTREIIASCKGKIKYLYKENGGESSARNFGIQKAGGDYVAFLDSDDQWQPEKLQKQLDKLMEHPDFGIALSNLEFVDENGISSTRNLRNKIIHDGYILPYILKDPGLGCGSTVLAKKEVFTVVGLFDESFYTAADQDWIFRACSKFKALLIEESLVKVMKSSDSTSKGVFTKNRLRALDKMKQYNPEFCRDNYKLIIRTISQINLDYAKDLLWHRCIAEAREQIIESMRRRISYEALLLYLKSIVIQLLSFFLPKYQRRKE